MFAKTRNFTPSEGLQHLLHMRPVLCPSYRPVDSFFEISQTNEWFHENVYSADKVKSASERMGHVSQNTQGA